VPLAQEISESAVAAEAMPVSVWWPVNNAVLTGEQPFKAVLEGRPYDQYDMYWQVDNGQHNFMPTHFQDYPHKEALVNLSGWNWRGTGPYVVTFIAKDANSNELGRYSVTIFTGSSVITQASADTDSATQPLSTTTIAASTTSTQETTIWWPTDNAQLSGSQPFKAVIPGKSLTDYRTYWQVDGGQLHAMYDSYQDGAHKEAWVSVDGWNWRGSGPYRVTFVSKNKKGQELSRSSASIFTGSTAAPVTGPISGPVSNTANPFSGATLYVNPTSNSVRWITANQASRPADAQLMQKIASQPETQWFGNWNSNVANDAKQMTDTITASGALPVYIAYNIPQRDCGGYSAGGSGSADAYKQWIRSFASGIGNRKSVVILEPDALASMDCLSSGDQQTRLSLLADAVTVLSGQGVSVYLDAGHPGWKTATDIAQRLKQAGIGQAQGFALNVSNFMTTADTVAYGSEIAQLVSNKHFIIDVSRNGLGPTADRQWCNPPGRALGVKPTTNTGNSLVDAFIWAKDPGGSDGQCNGGPAAGIFWPEYALGLASRANW
jgi:endoglucanase